MRIVAFCFTYTLSEWDATMKNSMSGGLLICGFYEMKQDIFDILKYN